ncbi:MAG: peptidyl-tRNA hydrolase Pth2 [Nitrososphaeraceae archaeon]|nr:peptidyl-tRNA hydrolase Pth2 [Nitrososphaeraceae archaeon]MDW0137315.1 peptidyl-tRNA hydrolase Pth2 [Nitrososphaeraceae archaeon]MDW0142494.1 peptidyl-tRNA hydrolase Pth2 [Nitrososphaeraceae archaeon]MDW0145057.1 peptidyl-tRNA hydrolase Pth2 [Nitrososphaeraceae archaeon]MDW0146089.1 peptidyl-tRNA hydrolase Pth2 [Nitrososphaeraceae archaeon]
MEFKQVIVVRKDLRMGIGKIASQVGHAAVLGTEQSRKLNKLWLRSWFNEGQPKIVVKVNSLEELLQVQRDAEELRIPSVMVQDRGLTQIPTGTLTCIGIGPAPSDIIDKVTSELKLL